MSELSCVIQAVISANTALMQYLSKEESATPTHPKALLPKANWESASTSLVSKYTGEHYNWRELVKYCQDNELPIGREVIDRLELNSYPAKAWFEVYGVVLGKFA